jgi:hypothetical protein
MENRVKTFLAEGDKLNLHSLSEILHHDYHDVISELCKIAEKQALKVTDLETHQVTSQYISLCIRLIEEMMEYVATQKQQLIPYLQTLYEKSSQNHDCRNCNGGGVCSLQHDMQLMGIQESHNKIKDVINRLQMVALPLYSETIYPDVYRVLRSQMALLENKFAELYFIEEGYLIPAVTEAQKNIYANK